MRYYPQEENVVAFVADTNDAEIALILIQHFLWYATIPTTLLLPCAHRDIWLKNVFSFSKDLEYWCGDCNTECVFTGKELLTLHRDELTTAEIKRRLTRAQAPHIRQW